MIAPFVDKRWPDDKLDIYQILRLACNKAWKEGKFLGMTSEMFVPVLTQTDGQKYIIAPSTYPVLLALNTEDLHVPIRNEYFIFHRNGYGDIKNRPGCSWNTDVYDLGEIPVLDKNNIIPSGVRLGVRALGVAGPDEFVNIVGSNHGIPVYSYESASLSNNCCGCTIDPDSIDTINGVRIKIKGNEFTYINNVCFTQIQSITKTATRTPIEVVAITSSGNAYPIATLMPNQRFSKYRKYLVPNHLCGRTSLHGLFKISQQEVIGSESDPLILNSDEAIISLAIGIHNLYYTTNTEKGASYVIQGISDLEKEKREERSPDEFVIQVDGIYTGDIPDAMQRFS